MPGGGGERAKHDRRHCVECQRRGTPHCLCRWRTGRFHPVLDRRIGLGRRSPRRCRRPGHGRRPRRAARPAVRRRVAAPRNRVGGSRVVCRHSGPADPPRRRRHGQRRAVPDPSHESLRRRGPGRPDRPVGVGAGDCPHAPWHLGSVALVDPHRPLRGPARSGDPVHHRRGGQWQRHGRGSLRGRGRRRSLALGGTGPGLVCAGPGQWGGSRSGHLDGCVGGCRVSTRRVRARGSGRGVPGRCGAGSGVCSRIARRAGFRGGVGDASGLHPAGSGLPPHQDRSGSRHHEWGDRSRRALMLPTLPLLDNLLDNKGRLGNNEDTSTRDDRARERFP